MSWDIRVVNRYRGASRRLFILATLGCASGEPNSSPAGGSDTLSYEAQRDAERAQMAKQDSVETAALVALIKRGDTTSRDSVLYAQEWMRRTRADLGRTDNGKALHRIANDIYLDSIDRTLKTEGTVNNLLIYRIADPLSKAQERRFAAFGLKRVRDGDPAPGAAASPPSSERAPSLLESDASINVPVAQVEAAVGVIRSQGYTCSSVTGAWPRPYSSTRKLKILCNESRYSYELRDEGGIWIVDVR